MMKKTIYLLAPALLALATACNNSTEHDHQHNPATELKTREDSLYHDVMAGHDAVMPKMGKVKGFRDLAKKQLDSIAALPEKDKLAAAGLKASLDSLYNELDLADRSMDEWMGNFVPDSASDNEALRLQYLESEKMKVEKVKANVLTSLEKAGKMLGNGQ